VISCGYYRDRAEGLRIGSSMALYFCMVRSQIAASICKGVVLRHPRAVRLSFTNTDQNRLGHACGKSFSDAGERRSFDAIECITLRSPGEHDDPGLQSQVTHIVRTWSHEPVVDLGAHHRFTRTLCIWLFVYYVFLRLTSANTV
jgi:hypothetical protein